MSARLDTLNDAINFIETNEITDFHLRTKRADANSIIYKTKEDLSLNDNIERMKNVVRDTEGSFYIIENKKNGAFSIEVRNERKFLPGETSAAQIGSSAWDDDKVEKEVQRRLSEYQREIELRELRIEVSELRKLADKESPLEKFFDRLEPVLPVAVQGIMNKFFPTQPIGLAGIEQMDADHTVDITESTEDDNNNSTNDMAEFTEKEEQRIEDACVQWGQVDPKFYEVLEYLAGFAASGKTINVMGLSLSYAQLRSMLFNFKY